MKKRLQNDSDIVAVMTKVQEQLAVLDRKLDAFMTKSLKELAEALAAAKPAPRPHVPPPAQSNPRPNDRPGRQMYAVVCFDCGKDTEIPFKPTGDRPVYCKECFTKRKSGHAPQVNPQAAATAQAVNPEPLAKEKKKAAAAKKPTVKKAVVKKKAKKK